ncbi:hypothetical protein H6P81_009978 [Aristolochia fimbriata]|uniref:Uncharacterized protein n=1 Tax=Aristolochia fimbriata TaxID=158543 RepID=A0AAV7EMK0_ARIFI|nr:hypothetical protein H6P81_009978 [Aristolochia fimbriata]
MGREKTFRRGREEKENKVGRLTEPIALRLQDRSVLLFQFFALRVRLQMVSLTLSALCPLAPPPKILKRRRQG